ncbi:MAG: Ig-like domain-containing protein [Candidatus Diapherotrites archaeon]|nr:Ig-like domain-containing protein [Candidatus Diapherotrites archaeon]
MRSQILLILALLLSLSFASALLLDEKPGAIAAYSLRKLSSTYAGPAIEVQRASDNQTLAIGFDFDGLLDASAILSFCTSKSSADSLYVKTWNSQISGVPAFSETNINKMPLICENGQVTKDQDGYLAIKFMRSMDGPFSATGLTQYNARNVDVFVVEDVINPDNSGGILFTLAPIGTEADDFPFMKFGSGGESLSYGGGSNSMRYANTTTDRAVLGLQVTSAKFSVYVNQILKHSTSKAMIELNSSSISIGAETKSPSANSGIDAYVSEFLVYPQSSLSPEARRQVIANINGFWKAGPSSWNEGALLPQTYEYQVELYNWLKTNTVNNTSIPAGLKPAWNGYFENENQLASLWVDMMQSGDSKRVVTTGMMYEPGWFTLNDGTGKGIEATGQVRVPDEYTAGYNYHLSRSTAFWYPFHIPLAGGGEGNPYYHNEAIARRALTIAIVNMMMVDGLFDSNGNTYTRHTYYSGWPLDIADTYSLAGDFLPENAQKAFERGLLRLIRHQSIVATGGSFANMESKGIAGGAKACVSAKHYKKEMCDAALAAVKKVLFGLSNGSPTNFNTIGGWYPEGSMREAEGPETTYNNRALDHIADARAVTYGVEGIGDWSFLDTVMERNTDFISYQGFTEPGGSEITDGPSGYAARTPGTAISGAQGTAHMKYTLASLYPQGQFYLREVASRFINNSELVSSVKTSLNNVSASSVITTVPPVFMRDAAGKEAGWAPWPSRLPYQPPKANWLSYLRSLVLEDKSTTYTLPHPSRGETYVKTLPAASETWGPQFLAARQCPSIGNCWAGFVEATSWNGEWGGAHSGKLETFWSERVGIVLLNRRTESGFFDQTKLVAEGIWGKDDKTTPTIFNFMADNGCVNCASKRIIAWDSGSKSISIPSKIVSRGMQNNNEITGSYSHNRTFQVLPDGMRATTVLTYTGSDQIKELWYQLPFYVKGISKMYYWANDSWNLASPNVLFNARKIRWARDYNDSHGERFAWIEFNNNYNMILGNDFSQDGTFRVLKIDLHGNPGTARAIPASQTFIYTISVTENGVPPQSPNSAPLAANDSYTVEKDKTLTVQAPGVLANDTDADGDALTPWLVSNPGHAKGFRMRSDGKGYFYYTPETGFVGTDSFTYKANDGIAGSKLTTVTITVTGTPTTNQPPVLSTIGPKTVVDGNRLSFNLSATDPNGGTLIYSAQGLPAGAIITSAGAFTWIPSSSAVGIHSVNFIVSDGSLTDSEQVSITVNSSSTPNECFDLTGDLKVDLFDLVFVALRIGQPAGNPADVIGNDGVNLQDLQEIAKKQFSTC